MKKHILAIMTILAISFALFVPSASAKSLGNLALIQVKDQIRLVNNQKQCQHCTLVGANLSGADLTNADLTDANLTNANLSGANLTDADLSGADLTKESCKNNMNN